MPEETVVLEGCKTSTMMHYLKSLGVIRILSTQGYPRLRSSWKGSILHVHMEEHGGADAKDELADFFAVRYAPTPMVTPWNGGSGFHKADKAAREELARIEGSEDPRLGEYRKVIAAVRDLLRAVTPGGKTLADPGGEVILDKPSIKDVKYDLLRECRNRLPDSVLPSLDAMYVLALDRPSPGRPPSGKLAWPPLFGTGGNDAHLEFVNNFMKNLNAVFAMKREDSKALVRGALFGEDVALSESSAGMFDPGMAGAELSGAILINRWDYILMLEGALLFSGGVSRSLSAAPGRPSFPFTASYTNAGHHASSPTSKEGRYEIWAPVWGGRSTFSEIQHVFREGRAQLGGRQAADGAMFVRAVRGLGTERGLAAFHRFGILKRNGQSDIMTPLGRVEVGRTRGIEVLADLDGWMGGIRRMKNRSAGLETAFRNLEDSIFGFSARGGPALLQRVLISAGLAELALARTGGKADGFRPLPLSPLRPDWIRLCYDGSAEFRLAASLASMLAGPGTGPIRTNVERVRSLGKQSWWINDKTSVVDRKPTPQSYLSAILRRRLVDASKESARRPPLDARVFPRVDDVVRYLHGLVDASRVVDLMIPLSFVDYDDYKNSEPWGRDPPEGGEPGVPYAYAVLKLACLPYAYGGADIRFDPSILAKLGAGKADLAFSQAQNRLFYSGLAPALYRKAGGRASAGLPASATANLESALLFPLHRDDARRILGKTALARARAA